MKNEIKKSGKGRRSVESLVLGISALLANCIFFLLNPADPFGISIIKPMDAREEFTNYVFMLFLLLLLGVIIVGTSIAAVITGIKDFKGIERGLYIDKGKKIYLSGIILGAASMILFLSFSVIANIH